MDESWLIVPDAARALGISPQRVRSLLGSGQLAGRKIGRSWLVDAAGVRHRQVAEPQAGRPYGAENAWRLLRAIERHNDGHPDDDGYASAVQGTRIRSAIANLPPASELGRRLSRRARFERYRVHAGVLARLVADEHVSVGGGHAIAAYGGGIAAGSGFRLYVRERSVAAVVARYRLHADEGGQIELAVIPDEVPDSLLPTRGRPAPVVVGWVDLIADSDSRARAAADDQVERWRR